MADIWVGRQDMLKEYRRKRQKFPLLLPMGPLDKDTTTFTTLAAKCKEPIMKWAKAWIGLAMPPGL